jgi:hypothetical protein
MLDDELDGSIRTPAQGSFTQRSPAQSTPGRSAAFHASSFNSTSLDSPVKFTPVQLTPLELTQPSGVQLSLSELFFITTAVAIEIGVYLHVSTLLAYMAAGWVVLAGVIRFADIHNLLVGSIVGYAVAMLVGWIYVLTSNASLVVTAMTLIFLPACGYLLGALLAESQNLDC